jgi:hypothetical protein
MDCSDVERGIINGQRLEGRAYEEHLAGCETCRFLAADGAPVAHALASAPGPFAGADLAELEARVMARVAAERGLVATVRAWPRLGRLAPVVAVMALAAAGFYALLRRADWDAYPTWRMAATLAGTGALAVVLLWTTLRPAYLPPLSDRAARGLIAAGLLGPVVVALLPAAPMAVHLKFSYLVQGYKCFTLGGGVSLLVYLLARCMDRAGHQNPRSGIIAAAAGGLTGFLALQIECPVTVPLHILTGHASIPIGLALGYLFSRRL